MNHTLADKIARAVLYEGYILYPYRPSVKTRQRWTFGGLYPPAFSQAQEGTDPAVMQTQCLAAGGERTTLEAEVRFLHLMDRRVGRFSEPLGTLTDGASPEFTEVSSLDVDGKLYQPWQEATERTVQLPEIRLVDLTTNPVTLEFAMSASRKLEPIRQSGGGVVGVLERRQQAVKGSIEVSAQTIEGPDDSSGVSLPLAVLRERAGVRVNSTASGREDPHPNPLPEYRERGPEGTAARDRDALYRVTLRISNQTPMDPPAVTNRDEALLRALVSTHTLLGIKDGGWISLTDPPDDVRQAAEACRNIGAWPVLVGEAGQTDTLLSSPIILSDYPQVAPESPGDLFDSTEIDEILTLRIMTLTDEEKRAMAGIDERAAALLRRTESLAREQLMALHGTFRQPTPNQGDNE